MTKESHNLENSNCRHKDPFEREKKLDSRAALTGPWLCVVTWETIEGEMDTCSGVQMVTLWFGSLLRVSQLTESDNHDRRTHDLASVFFTTTATVTQSLHLAMSHNQCNSYNHRAAFCVDQHNLTWCNSWNPTHCSSQPLQLHNVTQLMQLKSTATFNIVQHINLIWCRR